MFVAKKYNIRFFYKVKQPQKIMYLFFFEQVEISLGKQTFGIICPTGKSLKKLVLTPGVA